MRITIAVGLEIVFAVLAFGVRSVVQWRRTGSTGYVMPGWNAPAPERLGAILFVAAIFGLAIAPAVGLGWTWAEGGAVAGTGFVLAVAGIALCIAAQLDMGDSWRIGVDASEETALVTGGLFSSIRNPIFTSMLVASAGFLLLVPNPWSAGAMVVLIVGLELQVRCVEEPYLVQVHGSAYRRYAARAGRFVPRLGTLEETA